MNSKCLSSLPPGAFECCGEYWTGICRRCGKGKDGTAHRANLDEETKSGHKDGVAETALKSHPACIKTKGNRGLALNKGESKVFKWLKKTRPNDKIIPHGLRLAFGDGTTYLPDVVIFHNTGKIELVEVKGHYRGPGWEQGYERYRRAADVFSQWFDFTMIDAGRV